MGVCAFVWCSALMQESHIFHIFVRVLLMTRFCGRSCLLVSPVIQLRIWDMTIPLFRFSITSDLLSFFFNVAVTGNKMKKICIWFSPHPTCVNRRIAPEIKHETIITVDVFGSKRFVLVAGRWGCSFVGNGNRKWEARRRHLVHVLDGCAISSLSLG